MQAALPLCQEAAQGCHSHFGGCFCTGDLRDSGDCCANSTGQCLAQSLHIITIIIARRAYIPPSPSFTYTSLISHTPRFFLPCTHPPTMATTTPTRLRKRHGREQMRARMRGVTAHGDAPLPGDEYAMHGREKTHTPAAAVKEPIHMVLSKQGGGGAVVQDKEGIPRNQHPRRENEFIRLSPSSLDRLRFRRNRPARKLVCSIDSIDFLFFAVSHAKSTRQLRSF